MHFGILGGLEVTNDGDAIDVKGPKQRALLTLLLLHANQTVSTDRIIDALWGEDLNGREVATLRVHIANLRRSLESPGAAEPGLIVTQPPGYRLTTDPDSIDANRFERLASEGRRLLHEDAAEAEIRLSEALSLWRGSALEEVGYEIFAEAEVRRLEELRISTIEDLFEARLALDAHAELVGEIESAVAVNPLRERLWGQLMTALYRSGRQADALTAFRRLSDILGSELGLEPGPELQVLENRIPRQRSNPAQTGDAFAPPPPATGRTDQIDRERGRRRPPPGEVEAGPASDAHRHRGHRQDADRPASRVVGNRGGPRGLVGGVEHHRRPQADTRTDR